MFRWVQRAPRKSWQGLRNSSPDFDVMDTQLDEFILIKGGSSAMVHSGDGAWKEACRVLPVALMSMPRMEERRQLSTPSSRESDDYYMELGWKCVVVELERRRREKITEKLPHFGQTVVVKKRSWELQRQGAFESTGEQVKYLTPVPEVSKGHAVLTDRGFVKVASYTIKDIKEPVKDQDELALVEVTAEVEEGKTNLDYMMNGWEFPRRRHRRSYLVWM